MIVGAALEAADAVGLPRPTADDDHRQLRVDPRGRPVSGADPVQQPQPVAVGEHQVEQQQRRRTRLDLAQRLGAAVGVGDAEPVGEQVVDQELGGRLVVLDDQE
ncbi:MAG: hypothetical protein GXY03_00180 [Solirubrobacterales bacterium]|nr:hypothetical protein [Solirubrobacterales bacterium]